MLHGTLLGGGGLGESNYKEGSKSVSAVLSAGLFEDL